MVREITVATSYQYDFYISYSHDDARIADRLYEALKAYGVYTFIDRYMIPPGTVWLDALSEAMAASRVILILVSEHRRQSGYAQEEIEMALRLARASDQLVIPIFLGDISSRELPYGLALRTGLSLEPGNFYEVVGRLIETLEHARRPKPLDQLERGLQPEGVDRSNLTTLAIRFFTASGREVRETASAYDLSVPELVAVHNGPVEREVIHQFGSIVGEGHIGFFVHHDDLPEEAEAALNTLRVHGIFIIPLSARLMETSLLDGHTTSVLHALMQQGRGGDNLFLTRNALIDRRFLFGRGDLLARIGSSLSRGEHVLLTGARKSGKTSFLNILRQTLNDRPVALIDLQAVDRHRSSWADELLDEIDQVMARWQQRDTALPQPHPDDTPCMVVILDEFERILPLTGESDAADTYIRAAGALRAMAQGVKRQCSIIAADLRPHANRRNELEGRGTNPLFQFFQEVPLPLLTYAAVGDMIRTIGRMSGIYHVEQAFIDRLHHLSGGHPFVARTLASAAYQHRRDADHLRQIDLDAGLEDLEDDDVLGSFFAENFWGPLSKQEQRYLIGMVTGKAVRNPAARAALRQQGLVHEGRMPIEAFADWLRMGLATGCLESRV